MISKTKISKRSKRKTNTTLVETIRLAKKNNLLNFAKKLSGPTRLQSKVNLNEMDQLKETEIVVVGKVLSKGNMTRKITVAALNFSEAAEEKLKKAGCEIKTIKQMLENNKELKGVKII